MKGKKCPVVERQIAFESQRLVADQTGKTTVKVIYTMDRVRLRATKGFTLIEMLVVIAIIGILAAIAIPQLAVYRKNAFDSQMLTDIRNAATAEEAYFLGAGQYTSLVLNLQSEGFKSSANVILTITAVVGPPATYTMTAVHSNCAAGSSRTFNGTNYSFGGTGCQ